MVSPKDPNARVDYAVDWSAWLDDDTITASEWIVPAGIVADGDLNSNTTATIWLTGGTAGQTYRVTNRITTAAGRIEDRTLRIAVRDK